MFDVQIRKLIDPHLERLARVVSARRITANHLTWLGFVLGMLGGVCIAQRFFLPAFALIALGRICDGLDGCVARLNQPTDVGGFLDIALDMIFYSTVPFAFAWIESRNQLPAAFLIYSFMGTGSSFLAFATISAKRGSTSDFAAKKSFFYSTGLIEGTETVVFLLAICLMPQYFPVAAWGFGGLCWITTLIRIYVACQLFK